nr:hypothetical protein [Streptomyces sp. SID14478]
MVRERGDVLKESRDAAKSTHARAKAALDWGSVTSAARGRELAGFSPFGHPTTHAFEGHRGDDQPVNG